MLVDRFGRIATDLRVSLTDRCNLRCTYCMPEQGLAWLPKPTLLTDDEIVVLVGIAVRRLGVTNVRFTGGEPLLRPGLLDIVARTAASHPRPELSLTTNGIGLARLARPLALAGLDRINVSLDTLVPDRFERLTRRRRLDDVLSGLAAADGAGLRPVKINAVLMRGINDDEAAQLLAFALERGYQLRFIEQMPLDAQHAWRREDMVSASEILDQLRAQFSLVEDDRDRGSAPAQTWVVDGYTAADGTSARVGVIASVTAPFCGSCDRTRLTADGQVRNCLFGQHETDLRGMLRDGCGEDEIAAAWRAAMWAKLPGHGIDDPAFLQPIRPMSAIGG
jgi:cyclic pyranopterin phosphate synthase